MKHVFLWATLCALFVGWLGTVAGQDCLVGTTERNSYRSAIAQTTMYYTVYLPPCYDDTTPYPTTYLMHGSASFDDHWLQVGIDDALNQGIAAGDYPPMILVLPYGEWIANENQFERVSWENVFLEELLPEVEGRYAIDTTQRAIGGISRGGFWAFGIAFRHPQMFKAVGGHSAFFDEYHAPPSHNPLDLALQAPGIENLTISLDRGVDDYARVNLDLMAANLTERGIDHTYTVHDEGEHDIRYWRAHANDYAAFYASVFQQPEARRAQPDIQLIAQSTPVIDTDAFVFTPPVDVGGEQTTLDDELAPESEIVVTDQVSQSEQALRFWVLPAVAFDNLQTNISTDVLIDVLRGNPNPNLILDEPTRAVLASYGVSVHQSVRTVAPEALYATLRREPRTTFTLLPFDALQPQMRVLNVDGVHPLSLDVFPLAFESETPNFDPNLLTRFTLSGVTALTRNTRAALDEYGVEWAASGVQAFTSQTDIFHTSNEVSFTPRCPQADGVQLGAFCSKDEHFELLPMIGTDIVDLNGNHNNDFGYENYIRTLEMYREAGIATVGGGETLEAARTPLVIQHNGNDIAMVSCNFVGPYYAIAEENGRPGAAFCDWNWLREELPQIAAEHDLLIVSVQYLELEEYLPSNQQVLDFRGLADLGADVVVGTQAHKPQAFEFYNGAFLHYGLGNLFFDQPWWGNSRFFMDTLYIYDGELMAVDLFTGIIEDLGRPRAMTEEEQLNFLGFMFMTNQGVR